MSPQIIPFETKHAPIFRDLNLAWLNTYFSVEPKDRELLDSCEDAIIKKGGYIFMVEQQGIIAGCYALLPSGKGVFEFGKMAVDSAYQGLGLGQHLMEHALGFARRKKWKSLVLYSSTQLPTALHIYWKFGFREIPLEKNLPYTRSDIKMELILD
ncbi:MAG: GNAT family N-acetyltransferase [Bacteroidota bacterium]